MLYVEIHARNLILCKDNKIVKIKCKFIHNINLHNFLFLIVMEDSRVKAKWEQYK